VVKHGILSVVGFLAVLQFAAAADATPDGLWRLSNGNLTVKVEKCYGVKICAKVAGLAHPLHDDGTPKLDENNPNSSLRSRPVIGIQIMDGMIPTGANSWKGKIYNADDGHTYSAYAKLKGNALQVKGCWGPFCKNLDFSRVN
jgi:uncharacterized protein (DUF2147 family)